MLVEHTAALVDHDAVAVRGGSDTLVFYAEHLTRAQRRVLRAHLLAALGDDDEPSVTIAVPSGWAAVEVSSRQRPKAPLTAGTVLFSVAAAAVLTVFVAAVIILVANEQRGDLTVAQAPDPLPTEQARPPDQVIGPGPQRAEQPSEQVATAAGAGLPADAPGRIGPARRPPGDLARSGTAPSVVPDLEAAASERSGLPRPPAVEPPHLAALPESPDVAVPDVAVPDVAVPDVAVPDVAVPDVAVPDVAVPDVAVPDDPDLEVEVPDVEEPGSSSGPIEVVDRDEDEAAEEDSAEGAGDDNESGDAPDGGSGDEEQADGGGAVDRVAAGVDLDD
jgi:hypothetical protein